MVKTFLKFKVEVALLPGIQYPQQWLRWASMTAQLLGELQCCLGREDSLREMGCCQAQVGIWEGEGLS